MFTLSINSTSNWPKSLSKLDKFRAAFPLSVRIVGLETITLQVGNVFIMHCFSWSNSPRICLVVFETASFVPICSIMCSGFFLSKGTRWCSRSSIVAPLKSQTFTTWLFLDGRFSSIPVNIESPTIKQVPAGHECLKLLGVSSLLALSFLSLLLYSEHFCLRKMSCFSFLTNSSWLSILVIHVLLMLLFSSFFSLLEWGLIKSLTKSILFSFRVSYLFDHFGPRVSNKPGKVIVSSIVDF